VGTLDGPIHVLAWQRTLGEMIAYGTLLAQSCGHCKKWTPLDPRDLAPLMGEEATLWDQRPSCPACGRPSHFMASPGQGTPFRPLVTPSGRRALGLPGEGESREFTATELMRFTPLEVQAAGIDLSVFCAACRVLRPAALDRLAAARGVQPVSAMRFRCGTCRGQGAAMLTWRDSHASYRSFEFSKA